MSTFLLLIVTFFSFCSTFNCDSNSRSDWTGALVGAGHVFAAHRVEYSFVVVDWED